MLSIIDTRMEALTYSKRDTVTIYTYFVLELFSNVHHKIISLFLAEKYSFYVVHIIATAYVQGSSEIH